jgi:hypothetical protein
MIANADGKSSEQIEAEEEHEINRARPEPKAQQTHGMKCHHQEAVCPVQTKFRGNFA